MLPYSSVLSISMATYLSGINATSHVLHTNIVQSRPRTLLLPCHASTTSEEHATTTLHASRRSCIGLAATIALQHVGAAPARADDEPANNGWWVTEFPLPVPKIVNKEINNKETGTRSFLRNGIYMADIGPSFAAHAYRLRSCAFDLLALEDLLGKDASRYVNKYLRLKSTFMYYDFDKLITAAPDDQKQPLTDLANRLFDSVEKLQQAVTKDDDPSISSCYGDTKVILQEVMARME